MYKNGFAIDNQYWLICHETKPNQTTTPGQSGSGRNDNKGVIKTP